MAESAAPAAASAPPVLEGWHLVLNGELFDLPRATDLRHALDQLVAQTGLHAICAPVVSVRTPDWSAFVMIAESHIALHGYGKRAFADVFSCRRFDAPAVGAIVGRLLPGRWRGEMLERSMEAGLTNAPPPA